MSAALNSFIQRVLASPLEATAVILGAAYSLLAVRRNRWCWVCGGVSSMILAYLAARARLPMQSALQVFYVGMSVYGFRSWVLQQQASHCTVTRWPLRAHALAWVAVLVLSACSARWLASETGAAWPLLDSLTTWASLVATWLVVRMKLENWIYWILIDVVLTYLFIEQQLYLLALLFAAYLAISVAGFLTWLKAYRLQARAA